MDRTLAEAAKALFDPMPHGSITHPNEGHTVETLCQTCVSIRSKRYQAVHRALVENGEMPSISIRAERVRVVREILLRAKPYIEDPSYDLDIGSVAEAVIHQLDGLK